MNIGWNGAGGSVQLYLERVLASGGLTINDVTSTSLNFLDLVSGLGSKKIDAAWQIEPFITISQSQQLSALVLPSNDVISGSIGGVLVMNGTFASQQPEATRRFVTAWLKGMREQYQAFSKNAGNPDEVVDILTRHTAVKDPNVYKGMAASGQVLGTGPIQNGEIDLKTLTALQDYYIKIGSMTDSIDLGQVFDPSYGQAAVQRLGRID